MSSSNNPQEQNKIFGTVFMGPNTNRESQLDILLDAQYRDKFSQKAEENYLIKIEAKAQEKVRKMLEIAQANVRKMQEEMQNALKDKQSSAQKIYDEAEKVKKEAVKLKKEAEELYASSKQKAYDDAIEAARKELEEVRTDIGNSTAFVMQIIANQFPKLAEAWKKELVLLLQDSVEVAVAYTLSSEKKAILEAFFSDALNQLEDKKKINIQTNPQDEALVSDIIADAKKTGFPEIESYKVQANPSLEQGSIIISSDFGHIENDYTGRRMQLRDILKHLSFPFGDIDQTMQSEVNTEVQKRLINLEQSLKTPSPKEPNKAKEVAPVIEAPVVENTPSVSITPIAPTAQVKAEKPIEAVKAEPLIVEAPKTEKDLEAEPLIVEAPKTEKDLKADPLIVEALKTEKDLEIEKIDPIIEKLNSEVGNEVTQTTPIAEELDFDPTDPFAAAQAAAANMTKQNAEKIVLESAEKPASPANLESSLADELLAEGLLSASPNPIPSPSQTMDQSDIDNLLK